MRTNRTRVVSLIAVLALISAKALFGQTPSLPPAAPVPPEVATAKKVFIANAVSESSLYPNPLVNGGDERCYDQLYAGMKEWGRYELVPGPQGADLIFEIGSCTPIFRLVIMDRETQVVLWSFSEPVLSANLAGNREKNFEKAATGLMADIKELTTRALPRQQVADTSEASPREGLIQRGVFDDSPFAGLIFQRHGKQASRRFGFPGSALAFRTIFQVAPRRVVGPVGQLPGDQRMVSL